MCLSTPSTPAATVTETIPEVEKTPESERVTDIRRRAATTAESERKSTLDPTTTLAGGLLGPAS